jgi:hypothetical protein
MSCNTRDKDVCCVDVKKGATVLALTQREEGLCIISVVYNHHPLSVRLVPQLVAD